MRIFKKEKLVVELVSQHIDKTEECVEFVLDAVEAFLSGGADAVASSAEDVNRLETEADGLLREIRDVLYAGAYLPMIRGDIYHLMSAVDEVANKAEDCADHLFFQPPHVGEEFQEDLLMIVGLTRDILGALKQALKAYFKPKGKIDSIREHARAISELESSIDDRERAVTVKIFTSSLPLAEKLHLHRFVSSLVRMSDVIEDAGDKLQHIGLKSIHG